MNKYINLRKWNPYDLQDGSGGAEGRSDGFEPTVKVAVTGAADPVGIPDVIDARGGMPSTSAVAVAVEPVVVTEGVEATEDDEVEAADAAAAWRGYFMLYAILRWLPCALAPARKADRTARVSSFMLVVD